MTSADTLGKIHAYWTHFLGCPVGRAAGVHVVELPHRPHDHEVIHVFCRDDYCILAGPPGFRSRLGNAVTEWPTAAWSQAEEWTKLLGERASAIRGPAWLGYADATDFHPVDSRGTRPLTRKDQPVVAALAQAAGPEAWGESGLGEPSGWRYGCFEGSELVAAGTAKPWGIDLWHLGILTHPAYRQQGWGRAVVSQMAADALAAGAIPQYRASLRNQPSLALASSLGFQPYAEQLAIHLR
jgi:GNAT superfamily N-acetyltransferase